MRNKVIINIFFGAVLFFFSISLNAEDEFASDLENYGNDSSYLEVEAYEVYDPFSPFNRVVYDVYKGIYNYGGVYIVKTYVKSPSFVKERLNSFSTNIREVISATNHLAQGRVNAFFETSFRFFINSTIGLLGFWDVMSALDMSEKPNDFGASLYFLGVPDGPYMILLGPANLRDTSVLFSEIVIGAVLTPYEPVFKLTRMQEVSLNGFRLSINGNTYFSMKYHTTINMLKYSEIYYRASAVLEKSVDEYSVVKNTYYQIRKNRLQAISSLD